jgi:hypothetical protein
MTKSFRILLTCGLAFMLLSAAACTGHHDGCRPNPVVTDEMAELDLPAPKSGKLCLAQTRLVTYEIQKDQSEVQPEFRERLEKAGWKETPNPATGLLESPSAFFVKNGRQVKYTVEKCHGSFLTGVFSSCSTVSFEEVTK